MKYIEANRISIQVEPTLDNDEIKKFIRSVKKDLTIFTNYESRTKENAHFFSNGPSISDEDEIILKLMEGADLLLAWGKNVSFDTIGKILIKLISSNEDFLDKYRVNSFDCGFVFGIDYKKNAYEIIKKAYYNENVVRFYSDLPDYNVLDNDIHILLSSGNNKKMSCSIKGLTSRGEIETNDYEEKQIRLTFGILFEKVSVTEKNLTDLIIEHHEYTKSICEKNFYPSFVLELEENIAE